MLRITPFGDVLRFDLARTIAGKGRYWTTCYWIESLLIDTGCAHTSGELIDALSNYPVNAIINTHSHEDHIGANGILQLRQPELVIRAHPLALPVLFDPHTTQPLHPYRRFFWGRPKSCRAEALSDGEQIHFGNKSIRVIYTPGHSLDHICLFEEKNGWLFSGDLFVGGRDRALQKDGDIWGILGSLKKVSKLPITVLFPGSARVRENPCKEISLKITYYQDLGERIIDYHYRGWSVNEIVRAVCGGPMWIEGVTLNHFARKWLVISYINNLSKNTNTASRGCL